MRVICRLHLPGKSSFHEQLRLTYNKHYGLNTINCDHYMGNLHWDLSYRVILKAWRKLS